MPSLDTALHNNSNDDHEYCRLKAYINTATLLWRLCKFAPFKILPTFVCLPVQSLYWRRKKFQLFFTNSRKLEKALKLWQNETTGDEQVSVSQSFSQWLRVCVTICLPFPVVSHRRENALLVRVESHNFHATTIISISALHFTKWFNLNSSSFAPNFNSNFSSPPTWILCFPKFRSKIRLLKANNLVQQNSVQMFKYRGRKRKKKRPLTL